MGTVNGSMALGLEKEACKASFSARRTGKVTRSLALSKEEIGLAIGKNAAVLAVTDRNLASRLTELFGEDS